MQANNWDWNISIRIRTLVLRTVNSSWTQQKLVFFHLILPPNDQPSQSSACLVQVSCFNFYFIFLVQQLKMKSAAVKYIRWILWWLTTELAETFNRAISNWFCTCSSRCQTKIAWHTNYCLQVPKEFSYCVVCVHSKLIMAFFQEQIFDSPYYICKEIDLLPIVANIWWIWH